MHRSSLLRRATRALSLSDPASNWVCRECRRGIRSTAARRSNATTSSSTQKPYYVTTPIFYVNAAPHVGHMYSMVLADILKRHADLRGDTAVLATGTDEHGMKVQRAAGKAGSDPKSFCDKGAEVFQRLAERSNISHTNFIRTTSEEHKDAVQFAWRLLQEKGLLYTSSHEGWYAVSDETFYPAKDVHLIIEPWSGRKHMASIETGKEVEWTEEQNWHFRLSAFQEPLLKFLRENPDWIQPRHRYEEVVGWVTEGLPDLSVSRPSSRLTWGVPVPEDPSQTIYVWLDALINYITVAGYPWPSENATSGGWPADIQVIGKDIVRFHCIYWPAFLMALDLPLPKTILTHAHWRLGNEKMSKSTGNVVNPFYAIDRFGVDVMRYYLARDGGIKDDGSYENRHIITRYDRDLKSQLGNCASRLLRSKKWSVKEAVKAMESGALSIEPDQSDNNMLQLMKSKLPKVEEVIRLGNVPVALSTIIDTVYKTNVYFTQRAPWDQAAQEQKDRLHLTVYLCAEALRITGILLQPYMPSKAAQLLDMLGVDESRRTAAYATPRADFEYGESRINLGKGEEGTLFPPLTSFE